MITSSEQRTNEYAFGTDGNDERWAMSWHRIDEAAPPVDRPLMVRTAEESAPRIAFLSADGVWHEGGALVQTASTLLAATPTEWCEPEGDNAL